MTLKCIVHCNCAGKTKYSKNKTLSETNKERIISAKTVGEKIGGNNHHEEQCSNIPEIFEDIHDVQMEQCREK